MSRRGTPNLIISDNFSTSKSNLLKLYLRQHDIVRQPILASAPWWGGFYERLVRSIKLSLKKTIGKARLTFEELNTVLIEVLNVVKAGYFNCKSDTL